MLQCHESFFPVKHNFWFIQRKLYSYQIFSNVKYELHKKDLKKHSFITLFFSHYFVQFINVIDDLLKT